MLYYLLTFLILRTSLLHIAMCVRFVVLRDAETRRAWQQHQANVNAAADAAALRAMHEGSARLAGEPNGGRLTSNFYLAKIRYYNLQCLCFKCTSTNFCALKKTRNFDFQLLFDKCTCAMLYYLLGFVILLRCSRRKNNFPSVRGKKSTNLKIPSPLFYAPMHLCLGFIAANPAADEAARMAARAWRAPQLVDKEILRKLLYTQSRVYFTVLYVVRNGSYVLEYTVVHTVQAADPSLLFECTILHSKP